MDKKKRALIISFIVYIVIFLLLALFSQNASRVGGASSSQSHPSSGFSSPDEELFFGVPLYIFFLLGFVVFLIIFSKDIAFFLKYFLFNIASNKKFNDLLVVLSSIQSEDNETYIKEVLRAIDTLVLSRISRDFLLTYKKDEYDFGFEWDFFMIKDNIKDDWPLFYIVKNSVLQKVDKKGLVETKSRSLFAIHLKHDEKKFGSILIKHSKPQRASFIADKFYREFFVIANLISTNMFSNDLKIRNGEEAQ